MTYIFFLFFFLTQAFAQDIGTVSDILEKGVTPSAEECDPSSIDQSVRVACVKELCGSPGSYPSNVVKNDDLKNFTPDENVTKEIDRAMKLVTEATKKWQKDFSTEMDKFKSYILQTNADFKSINANLTPLLDRYVSYRVQDGKIKIIPEMGPGVSPIIEKGIKEWIKNREETIQTDPLMRMRLGLNSPEDSYDVIKIKLQELKKQIERLPGYDQKKTILENDYRAMKNIYESPVVSEMIVFQAADFLEYVKKSMAPQSPSVMMAANQFDPACKGDCLKAMDTFFTKDAMIKLIEAQKEKLKNDETPFIDACKNGLLLQAKYGQLPGQREKALRLVDSALEKVTSLPWWSSSTKEKFKNYIQSEVEIAHTFASQEVINKQNIDQLMSHHMLKLRPVNLLDSMYRLSSLPGNTFGTIVPFCPSPFHTISDSFQFRPEKSLIHVSPFSCEHTEPGESIVAHELGHALSFFMATKDAPSSHSLAEYKKKRTCVNNLTSYKKTVFPEYVMLPHAGDSLTTEEDMADWISHASVKTKIPAACAALSPDEKGAFKDSQLELQPVVIDPHSPPLLRAIRDHFEQSGNIPLNCSKLLDAYKGIVKVNKCE